MNLYRNILLRLLNELNVKNPAVIKKGLVVKNKAGFEYKIADIDETDPNHIKYTITRAGWRSEPLSYDELKKFKKD